MSQTKRVLILAMHWAVASGRYIKRALIRLGHDVRSVGPAMGRRIWGLEVDARYVWEPDGALDAYWPDWTPDLVLLMDSAFQYHHPHYADVPHVVYGVDSHVRNYRQPGVSHYFLAHAEGPAHAVAEPDEHWLPCGYDPEWHRCLTPLYQRPVHAALVGVIYEERLRLVKALAGAGWRVEVGTGALQAAYERVYNQAVVSVCRSAAGDVAQRIFETAAMGCVILSDPCADFERLGFQPNVHYLPYTSAAAACDQVRELFEGSDERIWALADNARRWAQPHTWDARCEELLRTVFDGK